MKERIKDALARRREGRRSRLDALSAALTRSRLKRQQVIDAALGRAAKKSLTIALSARRGRAQRDCKNCLRRHSSAEGCDFVHIREVEMRDGRTRKHYRVRGSI